MGSAIPLEDWLEEQGTTNVVLLGKRPNDDKLVAFDEQLNVYVYSVDRKCAVYEPNNSEYRYACESCDERFSTSSEPKYCPGCGARIGHMASGKEA